MTRKTESILAYLASQEQGETDPWVSDDLRISWLTVLYAARGYSEPDVFASYQYLGLHPEKVHAAILARREALLGKALLRKKPVQSVRMLAREKAN